jgi:hypothetical protein
LLRRRRERLNPTGRAAHHVVAQGERVAAVADLDGGAAAHQPGRADPDDLPGRGLPLDNAMQQARAQVEDPLVVTQHAVTQVERFVVYQQPDDLAIGDVDIV